MPLTIPGSRFWFENLFRVRQKDLPSGSDTDTLRKYAQRANDKNSAFFLVRKLPLSKRELPVCVHYYFNYNPRDGGEMGICSDFVTHGAYYLEAAADLGIHSMTKGLTLDDGTVLLPKVASHIIALPIALKNIPGEIKDRTDLKRAPVKTRTAIDLVLRGSGAALMNADTRMQTVLNGGEIDYIDPVSANITERIVHVRYRRR